MSSKLPFLELLKKRTVLFDGAMGTTLIANGLQAGESPEGWILTRPDIILGVHQAYAQSGADVLQTNTLGGTRMKLAATGLADRIEEVNSRAVHLARQACPESCYLAGDIGPTGQFLPPVGTRTAEELLESFREQAQILADAGVDLFIIETFYDLAEILLAVRAARSVSDRPVVATLSFERKPKGFFTMMGNTVPDCAQKLAQAGANVVGSNCGLGSADMIDLAVLWRQATDLPVLIQPNAGKPQVTGGQMTYGQKPESFAEDVVRIVKGGINAVGGCCGTTPEFIRRIRQRLQEEGLLDKT
jgi:methionine synthase I (cobalamin-dependent)